jgi:predicted MarR family transcription regulator
LIAALKADDGLNRDIGELARLLRVLSGMYDQAARAAASL